MAESGANARIIEIPRYSKMFQEEQMNLPLIYLKRNQRTTS